MRSHVSNSHITIDTGTHISATQCTEICNAMLCLPPAEEEQWTDAFQRASDAVWMSANREQGWDDLLSQKGSNNVVQGAIRLQQAVTHKAFEICQNKDMQKQTVGSFTCSRFVAGRDNQVSPSLSPSLLLSPSLSLLLALAFALALCQCLCLSLPFSLPPHKLSLYPP